MNLFTLKQAVGLKPVSIVEQIPLYCDTNIRILDVGVGTGRNAIFLARLGFCIDVIDSCVQAINEINEYVINNNLSIHSMWCDINDYNPIFSDYGLILCTLVLHYLVPDRAKFFLDTAIRESCPGTFHVIGVFTVKDDSPTDEFPFNKNYYPNSHELYNIYVKKGWIIHKAYTEKLIMLQKHSDGRHMSNLASFLIAQKP